MRPFLICVLAASLAVNAGLFFLRMTRPAPVPVRPTSQRPVPRPANPDLPALARLDPADLAGLRDRLRATGTPDAVIRAVLEGALRQQYRDQMEAWRIEQAKNWWHGSTGSAPSVRSVVSEPLQKLLGPDPLDLADAAVRYDFLSEDKRRLLAQIDLDYNELLDRTRSGQQLNASTKAEIEEEQLLNRERRNDLLAALSPEERAEYDLRFTGTAAGNAVRFAAVDVTEAEYRTIKPIIDAGQSGVVGDQPTLDRLVAAVGFDRTLDLVWSTYSGPYKDTVGPLHEAGLPAHNAALLLQLSAETGVRAAAIHNDPALSPEEKRAGLLALQQSVRPQFDALAPPAVQPKLPAQTTSWFTMLGEGRYQMMGASVRGSGWLVVPPESVANPPRTSGLGLAVPRRPGG